MNTMKTEIGQLAKAVSALTSYPRLVRRDYWIAQIENLLEQREISASDRQRLDTLLDLLRNTPAERFATATDDESIGSLEAVC
ncbi:hypothetical protein GCT13_24615 [Paraburkholderia sp. CNPSo 3157]|uniref:Uncharacterized protein n=1 Tax=Paraburkholderia franconis TaxID=2654983 RepID=A0A7X1TI89_9BURK|nr:hypothetical protein [Paraburkholderia franconis]MPW19994.1 hypothetical protein [Paraburkholderia franconis]